MLHCNVQGWWFKSNYRSFCSNFVVAVLRLRWMYHRHVSYHFLCFSSPLYHLYNLLLQISPYNYEVIEFLLEEINRLDSSPLYEKVKISPLSLRFPASVSPPAFVLFSLVFSCYTGLSVHFSTRKTCGKWAEETQRNRHRHRRTHKRWVWNCECTMHVVCKWSVKLTSCL